MKTLTKPFKSRAAVAAVALAAVIVGGAPAFAQDVNAPQSSHDASYNNANPAPTLVRTRTRAHRYYDYVAPRRAYDYVAPQPNWADPDTSGGIAGGGWW